MDVTVADTAADQPEVPQVRNERYLGESDGTIVTNGVLAQA
jgi:hypothetical protein